MLFVTMTTEQMPPEHVAIQKLANPDKYGMYHVATRPRVYVGSAPQK